MGRRALPRIPPGLDLSRQLYVLDQLPPLVDFQQLFPQHQPLEIEIGSGKGLFLVNAAETRPQSNFLGIEISGKYARFCAARLAKKKIDNGVMLHGDGRFLVEQLLGEQTIHAAHIYFPDPWWKKRHHKRRLLDASFVQAILRSLIPGGSMHLWTDVAEYYETTRQTISHVGGLVGPYIPEETPPQHDLDYRTHFERRMRKHNQNVYRAEFRKS